MGPRSDPDVNSGPQLTMASLTRSDKHSAGAALLNRGAVCTGRGSGWGGGRGNSVLCAQFFCEPKTVLKKQTLSGRQGGRVDWLRDGLLVLAQA